MTDIDKLIAQYSRVDSADENTEYKRLNDNQSELASDRILESNRPQRRSSIESIPVLFQPEFRSEISNKQVIQHKQNDCSSCIERQIAQDYAIQFSQEKIKGLEEIRDKQCKNIVRCIIITLLFCTLSVSTYYFGAECYNNILITRTGLCGVKSTRTTNSWIMHISVANVEVVYTTTADMNEYENCIDCFEECYYYNSNIVTTLTLSNFIYQKIIIMMSITVSIVISWTLLFTYMIYLCC